MTAQRPHRSLPETLVDDLIERLKGQAAIWLMDRLEDGVQRILDQNHKHVFFRPLNLKELRFALKLSDGLIACDSGPAHIASAVGCPAVILFGPTLSENYRPPGKNQILEASFDCRPCNQNIPCPHDQRCLKYFDAEAVLEKLNQIMI